MSGSRDCVTDPDTRPRLQSESRPRLTVRNAGYCFGEPEPKHTRGSLIDLVAVRALTARNDRACFSEPKKEQGI